MAKSSSDRILVTPSAYARTHYLYVQEVGSLKSLEPHISSRKNLSSYLFFIVMSGRGTLTYQGETIELVPGDCVWLDCLMPYAHESSETDPWSLTWVHFDGSDASHFYRSYMEQELPYCFHPGNILPFVETLHTLYQNCLSQDFLSELKNNRCLTDLITMIYEQQERPETTTSGKLAQIRSYIDSHYAEKQRSCNVKYRITDIAESTDSVMKMLSVNSEIKDFLSGEYSEKSEYYSFFAKNIHIPYIQTSLQIKNIFF